MKTVIWDFNGTIIDDVQLCLDIENRMLRERNMHAGYTLQQYRDLFCFPVIDYYKKIGYDFSSGETYEHVSVEFNEAYDQGFSSCGLVDGFEEKLAESRSRGYQNVILSASQQGRLNEQCRQLGISGSFQEIIGISDLLAAGKIERARRWFHQFGVRPEDCIYIGDTVHDMETAQALGIDRYTLVACGHQSLQVLQKAADQVVSSLREVQL